MAYLFNVDIISKMNNMQAIRLISKAIGFVLVAIIVYLFIWFMLTVSCTQYESIHGNGYCGNDLMTRSIINIIKVIK